MIFLFVSTILWLLFLFQIYVQIESVKIKLNKTINDHNLSDESNTNTELLNSCLADSQWLTEVSLGFLFLFMHKKMI